MISWLLFGRKIANQIGRVFLHDSGLLIFTHKIENVDELWPLAKWRGRVFDPADNSVMREVDAVLECEAVRECLKLIESMKGS